MSTATKQLGGRILAAYADLLWRTCRVEVKGWDSAAAILEGEAPVILAAWHGQTHMLLPAFKDRLDLGRLALVVVGDHREEALSTFAHAIGGQTYPISMSDKTFAGARRLMALMKAVEGGKIAYIAPDGPDGPARVPKGGVAFLATRLEAWLIPIGAYCRACYHIKRWDRYSLPLPYSSIRMAIGKPFRAARDMERSHLLGELSQRLDAAVMEAEQE